MSSELVFKTTSDLEARKQELLSQLTSVKMELSKRSKLAEAAKRLAAANSDITQGKEQLSKIYEMHQEARAEHDRATRHLSWCGEELDLARAYVRSSIRRKRRANKSLKRLRNSYPPLPSSPASEPIWSPKDDELLYTPSVNQEACENTPYSPKYRESIWYGKDDTSEAPSPPPQIYRMSEDVKDKLAGAFGWEGRDLVSDGPGEVDGWQWGKCHCDGSPESMKICAVCSEKKDNKSEMAKKIEEIRELWHNHRWGVNTNGFSTCMCEDCYEEKDRDYWFEEWECGMRSPDDEEPPKTEKEIDEEEEKMAIWEDKRMIESLERGDRRRNR
jgi:hypothetical protein